MKTKQKKEETIRDRIWKCCPVLYQGKNHPLTRSLISFGFECGEGWDIPLLRLSCKLEAVNIMYKKYGIQVIADQVKEKYGELRYYYHIEVKLPWYKRAFQWICHKFKKYGLDFTTNKQKVLVNMIDSYVSDCVGQAEDDCYNHCEWCGCQIGTDWSPRIQTDGWINYICEDCSKKRYQKNNNLKLN